MSSIKKCLFPVAGYGTRFLPATKSMPKEMLPIVNKPLVQYGVEEAMAAGMKNVTFVTGRGKRAIADHFDISYELENEIAGTSKEAYLEEVRDLVENVNSAYIRQKKMLGLGHAILCGNSIIGQEAFGVVLADDLCFGEDEGVLEQMAHLYEQFRCTIVAVMEVPREEAHKYGVIEGEALREDLFRVNSMVEKPALGEEPSNLAVIGRYILTPDIFDILRETPPGKNGEIQLTDALVTQAKRGCVMAYKFKGKRFDCGSVEGFVEATNYCFENIYSKKNK